jgi:hypothetical protein
MTSFRQIAKLKEGVVPYATFNITPSGLETIGITMNKPTDHGTWDEAGPIAEALIELGSGLNVMLVEHLGVPDIGIELRVPASVRGDSAAREFADATGIDLGRMTMLTEDFLESV